MSDVLALNQSYLPINRVSWFDGLCAVLMGRAEVVEEYDNWVIHTSSTTIRVPAIIRYLTDATGRRNIRFNRINIWLRDKGECQYCGRKVSKTLFTYEHVHPQSQGGKTVWENIVVSCIPCNQKKGGRTPEQARMRLLREPFKPKFLPGVSFPVMQWNENTMPTCWKDYLGSTQYWHGEMECS